MAAPSPAAPAAKRAKGEAIGSREHFLAVYAELRAFIVDEVIPSYGLPAEAAAWNAEMLDYNVPGWRLCVRGAGARAGRRPVDTRTDVRALRSPAYPTLWQAAS